MVENNKANGHETKDGRLSTDDVFYSYAISKNPLEEENKALKLTIMQLQNELDRLKTPPLMVCEVRDLMEDRAIIKIPNGNLFCVNISQQVNELKSGDLVLTDQKNLNIVERIGRYKRFNVEQFVIVEKPKVPWNDIGGLQDQIREIVEVIELPLKKPELFKRVGIQPPKGILLHGPPGTGKTLLAKAVATSTNSTFIEVVGSELVQKFIGEGARLVKEMFDLAREKAPSIVFIDEIDAIAAQRVEVGTSGEREVQRTFMQFLAEIDGFKNLDNVKIIGCTNRKDILDPAILRPGRLDRLIRVPNPDKDGIREIFKIHTKPMNLDQKVRVEDLLVKMKDFSGAEIKAVVTEAGYFAIRKNREKVCEEDFLNAIRKVKREEELEGQDYIRMFG
ncbi:AAA family ATPase [Candidatus Woesearchaeota archaeon]|nr:AAA family ATPase [Candidatus Woesearchaeota archaeon]